MSETNRPQSGWHVDASIAARWILVGLCVGIAVTYVAMAERHRSERESLTNALASANVARAADSVLAVQAAASASQAGFNAGLAAAPSCPPAPSVVVRTGGGGGGGGKSGGGEIDDSAMLGPLLGAAMGAMGGGGGGAPSSMPSGTGPIPLP